LRESRKWYLIPIVVGPGHESPHQFGRHRGSAPSPRRCSSGTYTDVMPSTEPGKQRQYHWAAWTALAVLMSIFGYVVVLPLFRPRGSYLWGHYRFTDIYAAIPVIAGVLCAVVLSLTPARHRRRVGLQLAATAVILVPGLFMFDLVYALAQPGFRKPHFFLDAAHIDRAYSEPDPELGFVRKPFVTWQRESIPCRPVSYRTDENGFRNPPGITSADIVFIGDSFTEAALVPEEQTFVMRVGAQMGLRVVNLGRGAYGPLQELIVLGRFAWGYQPKVVVWQIFEGNDLDDTRAFTTWRANPDPPPSPLALRYMENSLIGRVLKRTEIPRLPATGIKVAIREPDGTEQLRELRYRFVPDNPDRLSQAFQELQQAISLGARLCASRGIQLIVVFIPTMVQVLEPMITFERPEDRASALPGGLVRAEGDLGNRLRAVCREPECTYIDAFSALSTRTLASGSAVFDVRDPNEHLALDGHDVVARLIVGAIRLP
jgi:hypothetical protein